MNAFDILKYGNLTLMHTLDGLSETAWSSAGVCGYWSTHDIMRHLASYESMLVEILSNVIAPCPTPIQEAYIRPGHDFNDEQVGLRKGQSVRDTLDEYEKGHMRTLELVSSISDATLRKAGLLPWYGADYSLDDFLVYTYYGHKREHAAQINVFRDGLK